MWLLNNMLNNPMHVQSVGLVAMMGFILKTSKHTLPVQCNIVWPD